VRNNEVRSRAARQASSVEKAGLNRSITMD